MDIIYADIYQSTLPTSFKYNHKGTPVLGSEHPQYVLNHANSVITNTKFESLASDLLFYFVFNLIP